MKSRIMLLLVLIANAVLMSALPAHGQQPRERTRPNIVFIISDDHRWDALGAAGNRKIKTPILDKLARDGVYFRQATIHVSQCAPSRATLLTGLSPHQSGYYSNNFLRSDMQWADRFTVPTMPGLLQQAGYQTVLVGKWHLATDPWLTGFSDVRSWLPEAASSYVDSRLARGNSRKKEKTTGFTNGIFADDAVEFLGSAAAKEKPFFLWLATTIPHSPYQPNPSHIEHLYEGEATADLLPPGFPPDTPVELSLPGEPRDAAKFRLVNYYESVSYLDELVGRVLATLEKQGLADNTIVVFLGDNGLMAGSRGLRGKVVPYEESVRVPLIIRAPKFATVKGRSDVPASSLDIPATILALAGVSHPKDWGGRDLRPILSASKQHGIDYAISEWADTESQFRNYTHRLIRTPRYKLIRWDKPDKPDELYDLIADPHETTNVINKPALRSIHNQLLRQLNSWMERTNDPARFWAKKNGKTPNQTEEARAASELRSGLEDKTPVKVHPRIYDAYAGRYEFVTRGIITIDKEGERLVLHGGEYGGTSELIPKSETEFVHKNQPMRFTFVRGEKGQVTHLVRRSRFGEGLTFDMKARRIE
ncbi:MAG: sulfatase-like hydrolase/transferase [Acidobacteria bacterium]|nr:sulfatase-like hydrolase/transferase [Acidobacteriota bacterium]